MRELAQLAWCRGVGDGGYGEPLGCVGYQVVLAWLLHRQPAIIPVPGASSLAQLDEILAATELKLNAATLDRLDMAGRLAS